jgi:hypothetical protein
MDQQTGRVMSHAERRRAKKPQVAMTAEMKQLKRERLIELRKLQRMIKSNGSRGKYKKYVRGKRQRGEDSDSDAGDDDNVEDEVRPAPPVKAHRTEASSIAAAPSAAAGPKAAPAAPAPPRASAGPRMKEKKSELQLRRERVAKITGAAAGAAQPSGTGW